MLEQVNLETTVNEVGNDISKAIEAGQMKTLMDHVMMMMIVVHQQDSDFLLEGKKL